MSKNKIKLKQTIFLIREYLIQEGFYCKGIFNFLAKAWNFISDKTVQSILILSIAIWGVVVNINNTSIAEKQTESVIKQEKWLNEERERKADLYLFLTDTQKIGNDKIRITFGIRNKGNDIAEKWQFRLFIASSLDPVEEEMMKFSNSEDEMGFKFAYYNTSEKIIYYNQKGNYFIKLGCSISLTIPEEIKNKKIISIPYIINHDRGEIERKLIIENPYYN